MNAGGPARDEAQEAHRLLWEVVPELWFVGGWENPDGTRTTAALDPTPRGDLSVNGQLGWMVTAATAAACYLDLAEALREIVAGRVPAVGRPTEVREFRAIERAARTE